MRIEELERALRNASEAQPPIIGDPRKVVARRVRRSRARRVALTVVPLIAVSLGTIAVLHQDDQQVVTTATPHRTPSTVTSSTTTSTTPSTVPTTTSTSPSTVPLEPYVITPDLETLRQLDVTGQPPAAPPGFEHGGELWAVYLAVLGTGDERQMMGYPEDVLEVIEALRLRFERRSVLVSDGDVHCDLGAKELLSAHDADLVVAAYYDSEASARQFAKLLTAPPVAIGRVNTGCAD